MNCLQTLSQTPWTVYRHSRRHRELFTDTLADTVNCLQTLSQTPWTVCRHRELSADTHRHRELSADTRRHRELSADTRRHRELSADTLADTVNCLQTLTDAVNCLQTLADTVKCLQTLADTVNCLQTLADTVNCLQTLADTVNCLQTLSQTPWTVCRQSRRQKILRIWTTSWTVENFCVCEIGNIEIDQCSRYSTINAHMPIRWFWINFIMCLSQIWTILRLGFAGVEVRQFWCIPWYEGPTGIFINGKFKESSDGKTFFSVFLLVKNRYTVHGRGAKSPLGSKYRLKTRSKKFKLLFKKEVKSGPKSGSKPVRFPTVIRKVTCF